jgi:hypothetical protein
MRRPGTTVLSYSTPQPDRRSFRFAILTAAAILAAAFVATVAVSAASAETLFTDDMRQKVETVDGSDVLLWKDQIALVDGVAMIRSGQAFNWPRVLEAKLACAVDSGTEVVSIDQDRSGTTEITVIDGDAAGCVGTIVTAQLKVLD